MGLGSVYVVTQLHLLSHTSVDQEDTWTFLHERVVARQGQWPSMFPKSLATKYSPCRWSRRTLCLSQWHPAALATRTVLYADVLVAKQSSRRWASSPNALAVCGLGLFARSIVDPSILATSHTRRRRRTDSRRSRHGRTPLSMWRTSTGGWPRCDSKSDENTRRFLKAQPRFLPYEECRK